jgi:hypothetical protein
VQDSDYNVQPALLLILAFALIGVFLLLTSGKEPPRPSIPQDAMDGIYANDACLGFQIINGTITFDGGKIAGKVVNIKGYRLETAQWLRFERDEAGCRLVIAPGRQSIAAERQTFSSPVIMLQLFSSDLNESMYWTRIGSPVATARDIREPQKP